jgi:single-strand DNA-binding protein
MNNAIIIGRLTKAPEMRSTQSGTSVCSFTVAVDRRFKNQNGEKETDFIPVVVWRGLADNCGRYLSKGSQVGVSGRIQTRNYEAQDGSKRYITEIVADEVQFLSTKSKEHDEEVPEGFVVVDDGDDLPF